jgi:DNA-binding transcriptional MocR family regulator
VQLRGGLLQTPWRRGAVDNQGLIVDAILSATKLVYVTPSHQLPLGIPMSLPRRLALLAWARQQHAAIVEDDYDSEFRYAATPSNRFRPWTPAAGLSMSARSPRPSCGHGLGTRAAKTAPSGYGRQLGRST